MPKYQTILLDTDADAIAGLRLTQKIEAVSLALGSSRLITYEVVTRPGWAFAALLTGRKPQLILLLQMLFVTDSYEALEKQLTEVVPTPC